MNSTSHALCRWRSAALLSIAAILASLAACSAPDQEGTFVVIDDRGRGEPNLTFGGVKLTATAAELIKMCAKRGWKHNIQATDKDQRAGVVPTASTDVRKFSLIFEDGVLIQLTTEFHKADPTRHAMSRHYAHKHRMADGAWAMGDGRRQTVVILNREGNRLHAVHVGRLRDRVEADRLLGHFVGDVMAGRKAKEDADPKPSDAPKP